MGFGNIGIRIRLIWSEEEKINKARIGREVGVLPGDIRLS